MRISMEITMTDYSVLVWVHETLGVGTLRSKTVKGKRKDGTKYLPQMESGDVHLEMLIMCVV